MRARSRSSIAAMVARPPRLVDRSSSSSGSMPSRTKPPSRTRAGGSSTRVRAISSARSVGGSSSFAWRRSRGATHSPRASAAAGSARSDWPRATRSRGPAVPRVTRPRMRSRSCTPASTSRRRPRLKGAEGQLLDGVEPVLDALELDEGAEDPLAQQPFPHRRPRVVEDVEQGAPPIPVGQALHELEVAAGERVEDEDVLRSARDEGRHVGEVALLRLPHVAERRPGGGDGARRAFAPEGLEGSHAEVGQELPARALGLEGPVLDRGARDRPLGLRGVREPGGEIGFAAGQDLAGTGGPDLVPQAVEAAGAVPLRDGELAGGRLQPRDTEARGAGLDGHEVRRFGGVEGGGFELGARRDDPNDLALDDSLRRPRVLHLLAEGHPETLPDEAGDVGGGGVVRDPAHRDRVAVLVLRAGGERDLERLRGDHRVLEEHLVEVAHPEEQQRVRVLRLHAVVLLHGGRLDEAGRRHEGRWSIS